LLLQVREGAFFERHSSLVAEQHSGLRTFQFFCENALQLCATDSAHSALYRLLANMAGNHVAAFDKSRCP
jgi:hypothetical protein